MATEKQPLTTLAMAILELLHERPMHPYEMTQLMRERRVDRRVKLRPGSLYHTVERLEGQGLIEVVDTQRQGRRPERTVYGMTEHGRDTFAQQTRQMLAEVAPNYPPYPVALSAGAELSPDDFLDQLRMRTMNLRAQVAAEQVVIDKVEDERLPRMYWIDFAFVHHQRKSELDWTQQLIDDLESGRIPWPDDKTATPPGQSVVDTEDGSDEKTS
ncbi:PadR family transcriptional regulator [Amycolatopsis taiwanensis]|uniref:PadR family transcriptional regulator n=1 Tax=Amycolatopsis taiwanensis TaxID=342230 RepID=A0A9W6R6H6_9PSEU|nr:PadR family transcriptional regulator [Amycolatopsis taiwanensis]GLY68442.1 PadR family transcriptional regulator [Amycolatopsis taiwanensis]